MKFNIMIGPGTNVFILLPWQWEIMYKVVWGRYGYCTFVRKYKLYFWKKDNNWVLYMQIVELKPSCLKKSYYKGYALSLLFLFFFGRYYYADTWRNKDIMWDDVFLFVLFCGNHMFEMWCKAGLKIPPNFPSPLPPERMN